MKVFCKECKHISNGRRIECHHPDNFTFISNWYENKLVEYESPDKINKNNNCAWYEKQCPDVPEPPEPPPSRKIREGIFKR